MASEINDKTKVELYAVLIAVPVVAAYILWMTTMYTTSVNAERVNEKQDVEISKQIDVLMEIRTRVIRIEEQLKNKER